MGWKIWPTHWAGGSKSWNPNRIHISDDDVGVVAYLEHHGTGSGNNKSPTVSDYARARLIAAAPDLLAACEQAEYFIDAACRLGFMKRTDGDRPDGAISVLAQLRAAIAKAKGEV